MTEILQHPYTQAFARALLHFVWQGAAIGIVGYVLLRRAGWSASARHATGVALLAAMLAAPVATTWYFTHESPAPGAAVAAAAEFAPALDQVAGAPSRTALSPLGPSSSAVPSVAPVVSPVVVLVLWLTGVAALSIRLIGGWFVARRLVWRADEQATPEVQSLARRVAGQLALDRVVRVLESSTVAVPVMVGWIRPVVILPTAALAGLTPQQLEALLAHELAHVCRHDYLVNVLQSLVETVLFYHPAVWWLSGEVRVAREHCCDDLAVGVCDRLVYATALAELAAMTTPGLALAATDGSLVDRVRRILGGPASADNPRSGWTPAALLALLMAGVLPAVWSPTARAAGDQSSVAGGVPSGVAGGVTGGVSGGVPGGVSGGVVGGVTSSESIVAAAGIPERDPQVFPGSDPQDEQKQAAETRAKQAAEQLGQLKLKLDDAHLQSAIGQNGTTSDIAAVRLKLIEAEKNIERARQLQTQGLVTPDTADQWKAKNAALLQEYARLQAAYSKLLTEKEAASLNAPTGPQADRWRADKLDMFNVLLGRAKQHLDNVKVQVQIGTAAGIETAGFEVAFARIQAALNAYENRAAAESPVSDADAAALKAKFAEALRQLEADETRFNVGVANGYTLNQSTLAALAVLEGKLATPEVRPETPALSVPAAALRDRVLREGATMSDDAVVSVLKDAAELAADADRAEVLLAVARQQTLTPDMVTLYVAAANGIRSDDERARVFKQPVRLRQGKGR